ncbi:MAG TPA: glycosyltransferase family 4 protein [Stellaceae bacterium]|nr:glycosyltransferase family 4 protein [Stellaceae bacterium]
MARIAFYAPLKPPDHDVPSGDRRVARLFVEALRLAGNEVLVASRLRSFDGDGDPARQSRIAARADTIAYRLIDRWRRRPQTAPDLWFTYHLYYKAPDWLGPAVSQALRIPYVIAEASVAMKRAAGPWALGHCGVVEALRRADLVIGLNPADREGVQPFTRSRAWMELPPFLDTRLYRQVPRAPDGPANLVTVAMMRSGDKLASYRLLGAALARLLNLAWTLDVIGDGPARDEVEAALAPLGSRVRFLGEASGTEVAARLAGADLFVWPAINEAYGMALLEAQASGVAVVAGNSGGVGTIIADGETGLLTPPGEIDAFAAAMRQLIEDPARCASFGEAAQRKTLREHDLAAAAQRLAAMLSTLRSDRAA